MSTRIFDLNVEEVLQDWEVKHAIREIIANAIDEQLLTGSIEIAIFDDDQCNWHIRDYGRGIQIEHFTLNEDQEKLDTDLPIIGKFGVGLKDALATFYRRGVSVILRSKYGTFRLRETSKHDFDDIITLHVEYDNSSNEIQGTEVILGGVTNSDLEAAKALFLKFSGIEILESTKYGDILCRNHDIAVVYIRGVMASEEENFLFSYNITDLTDSMKKRLNRERLNVGRTTYTDRVKTILLSAQSERVKSQLVSQIKRRGFGDQRDELGWIDISQYALNLLAEDFDVTYVTEKELQTKGDLIDSAMRDGHEVVVITERQRDKVVAQVEEGGKELRTLNVYSREYNDSFKFTFIEISDLELAELKVFSRTTDLIKLVILTHRDRFNVKISETMRVTDSDTDGVWDASQSVIVIKRSCPDNLEHYAGILLHEVAHATSGYPDTTRLFEGVLTNYIGKLAAQILPQ